MADFQVTNTVAEEWTYRAHPVDSVGAPVSGVTLTATVVSGDASVIQDPASPLDVRLLSGPTADGISVFEIAAGGNAVPGLKDIITMTQLAVPPPPAAALGAELIGPNPQP